MRFYLTFGQNHPFRNNWVEVEAENEKRAREVVFETFGTKWAFLYIPERFKKYYFPEGKAGKTLIC